MSDKKKKKAGKAGAKQSGSTSATVSFNPSKPRMAKTGPVYRYDLLDDWIELNRVISTMSEDEVLALLDAERRGKCRATTALRLHARMNKLRAQRERAEVIKPLPATTN